MGKELIKMINASTISTEKYYLMHPFSASSNIMYSNALTNIDFFSEFYVISNKTFERLAEIAALTTDKTKNTVIITGYRGCGKTNFLRFCKAIIDRETVLNSFSSTRNEMFNYYNNIRISTTELKKSFKESLKIIRTKYLSDVLANCHTNNEIEENISLYINQKLNGKSEYINFGEDKSEKEKPLEIKLMRLIEEYIEDNINDSILKKLHEVFKESERDIKNAFENATGKLRLKNFFHYLNTNDNNGSNIYFCTNYNLIEDKLDELLSELDIDQLLFLTVLIKMIIQKNQDNKIFFLFDNIDIISTTENSIFYNTIMKFWDFLREMRSYIDRLRNRNKMIDLVRIYDNCSFIFAMRETTAMHICDDLRDRVKGFIYHFDISSDVDVSRIIDKKTNYIFHSDLTQHIKNEDFLNTINIIKRISEDSYFLRNLYPLFNNDFKTVTRCLLTICIERKDKVNEAITLIDSQNDYMKYGGRGIIFHLIFEKFEKSGYLNRLGIFVKSGTHVYKENDITAMRICLTILNKLQKSYSDRFFVNQEESVTLSTLFEFFQILFNTEKPIENLFTETINNMFSLRNKTYWNHLITFDNILVYDENELTKAIETYKKQRIPILIRATMAGEKYLQTMCVHFEFFVIRFCSQYKMPLFCKNSYTYNSKQDYYFFEKIIEDIYNAVKNCCTNLQKYNNKIINYYNEITYEDILSKPFLYENKFHEERIIHSHISYIESYRWYLINNVFTNNIKTINEKIIVWIKKYLDLLIIDEDDKNKIFYSQLSEDLYNVLMSKLNAIVDAKYNDMTTRLVLEDQNQKFY